MIKDFDEFVKDNYNNEIMEFNFHTHNYVCGHATGTVSDYVKEAIDKGLRIIGISDHGYFPVMKEKNIVGIDDFEKLYLPQFDEAIKLYGDKIIIKKGIEIEYAYGIDDYYKKLLSKLDYLVLGMHYHYYENEYKFLFQENKTNEEALAHYEQMIDGIKSGYFKILAHPDVMIGKLKGKYTKEVYDKFEEAIKEAMENNVLVEINANGYRKGNFIYPTDELIEICKKLNTKVVIGSDNHKPEWLFDEATKKVFNYCRNKGLNIVKLEDIDI